MPDFADNRRAGLLQSIPARIEEGVQKQQKVSVSKEAFGTRTLKAFLTQYLAASSLPMPSNSDRNRYRLPRTAREKQKGSFALAGTVDVEVKTCSVPSKPDKKGSDCERIIHIP